MLVSALLVVLLAVLWPHVMDRLAWHFADPALRVDEHVRLFPSFARQMSPPPAGRATPLPRRGRGATEDGGRFQDKWEALVKGVVWEPGPTAVQQPIAALANVFGYNGTVVAEHVAPFLVDFERGKRVDVEIVACVRHFEEDEILENKKGEDTDEDMHMLQKRTRSKKTRGDPKVFRRFPADSDACGIVERSFTQRGVTSAAGLLEGVLSFSSRMLQPHDAVVVRPVISQELLDKGARPPDEIQLPLMGYRGLSVLSDIDDTIKITGVHSTRAVLENTFLRDFQAIPGMAAVYRRWLNESVYFDPVLANVSFHYVSGSPWPLLPLLQDWMMTPRKQNGAEFPAGSFHLKEFRMEFEPWGLDPSSLSLGKDLVTYKLLAIRKLLHRNPGRMFVLVGDSGEFDPEVYGEIMRELPRQVLCILIRNTEHNPMTEARTRHAFRGLHEGKYRFFHKARELRNLNIAPMLATDTCGSPQTDGKGTPSF